MKTVLITGAERGIGQALFQKFLSEGYFAIGTYHVNEPEPQENTQWFKLDLSRSESIQECVQAIINTGRKIDVVINNAGILADEEETSVVIEKLRKTFEVNLIGTIDFTEKILPQMSEDGHVVMISSTAGSLELVGKVSHFMGHYPAYKISKAALNMYARTLALKYQDQLIVSCVHPGWVKTAIGGEEADLTPEQAADGIYKIAGGRPETGGFWFDGERLPW